MVGSKFPPNIGNSALSFHQYYGMIGRDVRSGRSGALMGTLTSISIEDNVPWGILDECYEVDLRKSTIICDLTNAAHYLRMDD